MAEEKKPSETKKMKKTSKKVQPENVVEKKLSEMLTESSVSESENKPLPAKKKTAFPWSILAFVVLLIAVILIILYQVSTDFKKNANDLIGTISGGQTQTQKAFVIPITVVYDKNSTEQKSLIDRYVQNLEFNLTNTKAQVQLIDLNDQQGKDLLAKINSKYVPVFLTDKTVLNHPQYSQFSSSIDKINDQYVFKTEGMEYLTLPDPKDGIDIGAPVDKAKFTVMEYLSYSCEYCKQAHPAVEKLAAKYKGQVAWVIKNFDRGGPDLLLAQSAMCANDQGKFLQMSMALYDNQDKVYQALNDMAKNPRAMEDTLRTIAKGAGVNSNTMFSCINSNKYSDTVNRESKEGVDFGVIGTPTFFFGNQYVGGYIDEATMEQMIQQGLGITPAPTITTAAPTGSVTTSPAAATSAN